MKFVDLSGQKFSKFTILKRVPGERGRVRYACICECGTCEDVDAQSIKNGRRHCCYLCLGYKQPPRCKSLADTDPAESALRDLYRHAKGGAIRRKYSWNLEFKFVKQCFLSACHYCKRPPQSLFDWVDYCTVVGLYTNGLDRRNNEPFYNESNVVPCCWTCNKMKGTMTEAEFKAHLQLLRDQYLSGTCEIPVEENIKNTSVVCQS
jgi:hypothetical protein